MAWVNGALAIPAGIFLCSAGFPEVWLWGRSAHCRLRMELDVTFRSPASSTLESLLRLLVETVLPMEIRPPGQQSIVRVQATKIFASGTTGVMASGVTLISTLDPCPCDSWLLDHQRAAYASSWLLLWSVLLDTDHSLPPLLSPWPKASSSLPELLQKPPS